MESVQDGNLACGDVRNHLGDEERIEARASFLARQRIVAGFFFECTDASDAGAEDDADTVQIFFLYVKTGIAHGLFGYRNGILRVQVHLAGFLAVDVLGCIEVLHLACKLCLEKGSIEMSNRSSPANPVDQILPKLGDCVANGGNGTKTCYHDSF